MRKMLAMFVVVMVVGGSGAVNAEIIAECGAFEGHSYFFEGAFVSADDSGWDKDKISSGSTSIVLIDKKFDVIFTDIAFKNKSSRADGASVIPLNINKDEAIITLLVNYEGFSSEFYTYHGQSKTLVLQQVKINSLINAAKMMVARCQ